MIAKALFVVGQIKQRMRNLLDNWIWANIFVFKEIANLILETHNW